MKLTILDLQSTLANLWFPVLASILGAQLAVGLYDTLLYSPIIAYDEATAERHL